ncbi:MAG TPA: hypothetical protein VFP22_11975 [Candidatus Limnocylindrales bacterium]|nr:hypothetical protein [Candidatus Limnocylindrales bacterium]
MTEAGAGPHVRRSRDRLARALVIAAILAAGLGLSAPVAGSVAAESDGLTLATSTTYTLVPAAGRINVVVDVTARNTKPNRVSGGVVTRYFFDGFRLGVQPEARSIAATSGSARLSVTTKPLDGYTQVDVRFASGVFFNQTALVRVTFQLPGGKPRSSSEVRVGPAFATFVAWAFGDSGSVRIVVPSDFDTASTGSDVTRQLTADATVLTATGITEVTDWYVVVIADRPVGLTNVEVKLPEGEQLLIRAWPDDPVWLDRVTSLLRKGLPDLVAATGLRWPVAGPLSIVEVHTPLLEGYAGIFLEGQDKIEVSEDLDDLTIIHESSHAWFNSSLFDGRWIDEGFADTYASETLARIGEPGWAPGAVSPRDAAAVKLNDWRFPGRITDSQTDAREKFGYDASWTVIRTIVDEVGIARMRDVLDRAEKKQIAYVGAGTPEQVGGSADWRRLLDLVDEVGGSTQADDLFRTWVLSPGDVGLLDARSVARTKYAALVRHGSDWQPPIYVRLPMSQWSFATADDRIAEAEALLAKRDALGELATALGLRLPTDLRTAYQTASDSLAPAAALADREIGDVQAIQEATAAIAAPRDPVLSLGLIGTTPETQLADARAEVERADPGARAAANAVVAVLAGATEVGRERLLLAFTIAILAFIVVVVLAIAARRRRRRRVRAALLVATAEGSAGAPPDVPGEDTGSVANAPYATLAAPAAGADPIGPASSSQPAVEPPSATGDAS